MARDDQPDDYAHEGQPAMESLSRDERKAIVKEAIKEWLDEEARRFGWWSLRMLASAAAAAIAFFILWSHGWGIK